MYQQGRSHYKGRSRAGGTNRTRQLVIFVVAVLIFIGGMFWFRKQAARPKEAAQLVVTNNVVDINPVSQAPAGRDRQETTLYNVGHTELAVASRAVDDHTFHETIVAHLSPPSDGHHYQTWLVRDQPFDFFATGSMTPNADGTYALIWDGEQGKDFQDYDRVVVTLEVDGGDPGPSGHVLEGTF